MTDLKIEWYSYFLNIMNIKDAHFHKKEAFFSV